MSKTVISFTLKINIPSADNNIPFTLMNRFTNSWIDFNNISLNFVILFVTLHYYCINKWNSRPSTRDCYDCEEQTKRERNFREESWREIPWNLPDALFFDCALLYPLHRSPNVNKYHSTASACCLLNEPLPVLFICIRGSSHFDFMVISFRNITTYNY